MNLYVGSNLIFCETLCKSQFYVMIGAQALFEARETWTM